MLSTDKVRFDQFKMFPLSLVVTLRKIEKQEMQDYQPYTNDKMYADKRLKCTEWTTTVSGRSINQNEDANWTDDVACHEWPRAVYCVPR